MQSKASTVAEYVASLPEDRRRAIEAVRAEINRRLPEGYEEGMLYGMIGWYVPHRLFPAGYHCDPSKPLAFAGLASQKGAMSVYLMCIYGDAAHRGWFASEWQKTGKQLDMGKSCIRFKRLDDLPLALIGEAIARVPVDMWVSRYAQFRAEHVPTPRKVIQARVAEKKKAAKQAAAKRKPAPRR